MKYFATKLFILAICFSLKTTSFAETFIYPKKFEKYDVKLVPTIVKDKNGDVKKISGHIALKNALEIFSN